MPKSTLSSYSKVRTFVIEFPAEFNATPKGELYCKVCALIVNHERRSSVLKHRDTRRHRERISAATPKQSLLSLPTGHSRDELINKVTSAFLSADIPLHKLLNPALKDMFQFLGHTAPSVSCCRARVFDLATSEADRLKTLLTGKDLFMVIDESDVSGRKFVNVLVGDIEQPSKVYLVSCKVRI